MILECNVWCSESDKNRDLGLPDGDCWMPIAIDFTKVQTIREAGENDFLGNGKATIYVATEYFIIDVSYVEAIRVWLTALKTSSYKVTQIEREIV